MKIEPDQVGPCLHASDCLVDPGQSAYLDPHAELTGSSKSGCAAIRIATTFVSGYAESWRVRP